MNEKIKGVLTTLLGIMVFALPFLLDEDPDAIVTIMVTSLCTFCSILTVFAGQIMIYGGPSNKEIIAELEKRVETLEER